MKTQVKTAQEIRDMRASGKILATILEELIDKARVGMQTREIDLMARKLLEQHKAEAAFLNYQGFPGSICISINEEIAHGIPGEVGGGGTGLPHRRDPGSRQDDLRPAGGH